MNEMFTMTHLTLGAAIILLFYIILIILLCYFYNKQKNYEFRLIVLNHNLKILTGGSYGLGEKLTEIENKFRIITQRQEEIEHDKPQSSVYFQAANLLKKGLSLNEVSELCHIPLHEAKLIYELDKKK